jgi:hypothetical protein
MIAILALPVVILALLHMQTIGMQARREAVLVRRRQGRPED